MEQFCKNSESVQFLEPMLHTLCKRLVIRAADQQVQNRKSREMAHQHHLDFSYLIEYKYLLYFFPKMMGECYPI